MNVVICIIVVGLIALVAGFTLGRRRVESTLYLELIKKINFVTGAENQTLKDENEELKKKNLFFKGWFVRSYIEQYYRKKLALGEYQIYTSDALEDLKNYAKMALDNFEKTWNSKPCNEQCEWIKEFLEELISNIDSLLDDRFNGDILDSENEDAFRRFFVSIENSMFFDRNAKENGDKRENLSYWEPAREHEDLC
jgi:uncharacterized protein YfaT (DUF1175 family)